jgi:hypothetical protein
LERSDIYETVLELSQGVADCDGDEELVDGLQDYILALPIVSSREDAAVLEPIYGPMRQAINETMESPLVTIASMDAVNLSISHLPACVEDFERDDYETEEEEEEEECGDCDFSRLTAVEGSRAYDICCAVENDPAFQDLLNQMKNVYSSVIFCSTLSRLDPAQPSSIASGDR